MNANGLYSGLELGAVNGVYNGINSGVGNGAVSNETRPLNIPILDRFTGAVAAYSLRKLRKQYSGPAIRVRRSSDNLETDIGFDSSGNLNTNHLIQFVGANSGFISIWYSQGADRNVNFSQTTQGSQPRIVNAGVIDLQNGKPALVFDGTDDFMGVDSSTASFNYLHNGTVGFISIVARFGSISNPNNAYIFLDNKGTSLNARGYSFFYDDRASVSRNNAYVVTVGNGSGGSLNNTKDDQLTPNTQLLITQINDPSNATAANRNLGYVNNGNIINNNISTAGTNTGNAQDNMRLGITSNSSALPFLGSVQEIVLWNVNKASNRNDIELNINNYYKIY